MSWYAPGSIGTSAIPIWSRRLMISVVSTGAGAFDVDVTIPSELDDFWTTIDASGLELRAVSYDSKTKLSYSVDNGAGGAFDRANRLGRVRIDAVTMPAAGVVVLWLYYGSTTAQGTGAVATAIAAALNGFIETSVPWGRRALYDPTSPRLTRPKTILPSKRSTETVQVWFDVTKALARRQTPGFGGHLHEEAYYATMQVLNNALADQAAMYDQTQLRWVYHQPSGRTYLMTVVTGGSSGTLYNVAPTVRSMMPGGSAAAQTFQPIAGLGVRDTVLT